MPYGLAIGTVTYGSRLHISLRYRHPLFSGDAARSFAGTYVEALKAVSAAAPGCADAIKRRQGSYAGMESQTWGAQCLSAGMLFAVAVAVKLPSHEVERRTRPYGKDLTANPKRPPGPQPSAIRH
jgi:hypothetical protein